MASNILAYKGVKPQHLLSDTGWIFMSMGSITHCEALKAGSCRSQHTDRKSLFLDSIGSVD